MKSYGPQIILLFLVIFNSCRNEKSIEEQMSNKTTCCYRAISNGDTAYLSIDTASSQIIGLIDFNYVADKKKYKGQFRGVMNQDTLKGHYDFQLNNLGKWYRNPVAFLKQDGKFIMGVGKFSMVWGSAYFDEKIPVDYAKGRFVFERGECEFKK